MVMWGQPRTSSFQQRLPIPLRTGLQEEEPGDVHLPQVWACRSAHSEAEMIRGAILLLALSLTACGSHNPRECEARTEEFQSQISSLEKQIVERDHRIDRIFLLLELKQIVNDWVERATRAVDQASGR